MSVSRSDVQLIAALAHLEVDEEMLDAYAAELSNIMEMVGEMQEVDTDAIEPMPHPQDIELRLRSDDVTEPEQRDDLQEIAPQTSDGLYLVPKVLE